MNKKISLATIDDMPEITEIFKHAREEMKAAGNSKQWGNDRPKMVTVEEDIANEQFFLVKANEQIVGVFAFIIGKDPTYAIIKDGQWLNDDEYGTIHRIAAAKGSKGIADVVFEYCESKINNVRIDTHEDNKIMQHILDKRGYVKCGKIYVDDGSERIAYQRK